MQSPKEEKLNFVLEKGAKRRFTEGFERSCNYDWIMKDFHNWSIEKINANYKLK